MKKMIRNPEARSNPYRVPEQPAQLWIKITITVLVLLNALVIGAVAFIYVNYSLQCSATCQRQPDRGGMSEAKALPSNDVLHQNDDAMFRPEEPMEHLSKRIDNTAKIIAKLQTTVKNIEVCCSKQAVAAKPTDVSLHESRNHRLWTTQKSTILQIESKIESLSYQMKQHMNISHQVCKRGHYRYGMLCLYIGEAALTQSDSKSLCENDVKGHLVIVKDQLIHDFLATKLPNSLHSYWIGIERQLGDHDFKFGLEDTSSRGRSDLASWIYMDGRKVQDDVWQIWERTRGASGHKRCVGMSFSQESRRWVWHKHDCQERLNFICQYFILSLGV